MKKLFRKVILKITPKFYNRRFRKNNKQKDFTFISQNCIGGVLYHMLGVPFASPTINMFIEDENFTKLAENPKYYFSMEAEPAEEQHVDAKDPSLCYPTIKVDDIILCCQHYKSCAEAIDAWNRRRLRVNYDKIYVIACSWNLNEKKELVKKINDLPYPSVIFTTEEFDYPRCVHLQGKQWYKDKGGVVKPALTNFDGISGKRFFSDQFDFVRWINQ